MSGNSEISLELYKHAETLDKRKSIVKRRMFRSRKRELQASGALPKSKAASRPRLRKSRKRQTVDDSSRTEDSSIGTLERPYEDICTVATTGSSDR